jgi:hypothetical protein
VFIVPALGGDARLVAPEGRWPRFSPDGSHLAYWSGQWRGVPSTLSSAASVLPLPGSPRRVLSDFVMARDPLWAPDGRALLVFGRRDRTSPLAEALDWWWVPLDGGPPSRTGVLDLADFRTEIDRDALTGRHLD